MKAFEIQKLPDSALRDTVKYLMKHKGYKGVFALTRKTTGEYAYALITDTDKIDTIAPSFPLMPANAGKMVSRLTMIKPAAQPIVVILRPCELRALYELVKLEQASLENLLFISYTCSGVFTLSSHCNGIEEKLPEYWEKSQSGDTVPGIRETCTFCENFIPDNADIILGLAGFDSTNTTILFTKTPKAETVVQGMDVQSSKHNLESDAIDAIRRKRTENKQKAFSALKTEELGWTGLITLFGRCINCRACSSVCPICYCKLCYIRSPEKDRSPLSWIRELNQKGALRIPDDTVMYHMVRLLHVGIMCVGCGMCSDVCPTNIPIASIFAKVGDQIQGDMDYEPGKDLDQKMPLAVINPEDFADVDQAQETSRK